MSDYDKRINHPRLPLAEAMLAEMEVDMDSVLIKAGVTEITNPVREAQLTSQCAERVATKGLKYDQDKEPIALLSRTWLLGVSRVMGFGAKKYAAHNWRYGIERSRILSAALRHILAYNEGEDLDPETGLSHLDHASCCLMFAREMHDTHPELDDRYKGKAK